jgi:hypothetical protein
MTGELGVADPCRSYIAIGAPTRRQKMLLLEFRGESNPCSEND